MVFFFFFFSSRRRHTRFSRDWSSDVCSSDLQFVLEYATERAGDLLALSAPELGLGVVNPRTEQVESVDAIKHSIERALKVYRPEQLFVNPDCGFATFSNRPVNSSA